MKSIGERIAYIREIAELNQGKFGEAINISRTLVCNIESGIRNVTDRTIADVCRVFNVNEEWLRNGTGEIFQVTNDDLDYLIGKYSNKLTSTQKDIVIAMLTMNDNERVVVDKFIEKLFSMRNSN